MVGMRPCRCALLCLLWLAPAVRPAATAHTPVPRLRLRTVRTSPQDLAITGTFLQSQTRFVAARDLLRLPQVHAVVTDDPNFAAPEFHTAGARGVGVSGVPLDTLASALGLAPPAQEISAICDDQYEAHYAPAYRHAHHPILVLRIDGRTAAAWPRPAGQSYGPFLISHPRFSAGSSQHEAQIPYGVVALSFVDQAAFDRALLPPAPSAPNSPELRGMAIAAENCLRCHDAGLYGGHKAYRSWAELARLAASHPDYFQAYVRDPHSRNPYSHMPPNPNYDARTLRDLTAYFKTFHTP